MTCHHGPNDPECSSHRDHDRYYPPEPVVYEAPPKTPDKEKYEITDVHRVGAHLVLKVRYPNCDNCAYEGNKVMVFLNVPEAAVLRWRVIDPHFRAPKNLAPAKEAPSPAARFPGSPEGWADAITYANSKDPYVGKKP